MIDLDEEEQALPRGAAVQEALQFQVEVGSFFEARRFVTAVYPRRFADPAADGEEVTEPSS